MTLWPPSFKTRKRSATDGARTEEARQAREADAADSQWPDEPWTGTGALPQRSGSGFLPLRRPPRFSRRVIRLTVLFGLLAASALAVGLWTNHRSQHVLSRAAVVRSDITEVGTRYDGVVASMEAKPGDRVKSGQILGRLANATLQAQETETLAQIEGLEIGLRVERLAIAHERASRGVKLQEVKATAVAVKSQVGAARLRAAEAQDHRAQRETLVASSLISKEAMRQEEARARIAGELVSVAEAQAAAAQSAVRSAELDVVSLAVREERLQVLAAEVRATHARLARIRADLESALIRAPDDGAVIRWLIKSGGSVRVGSPVVSMTTGGPLWVEAWVDEDELSRIQVGSPAVVMLASQPRKEFRGVVERIGITSDLELPLSVVPEPRTTRMRSAPVVGVQVRLLDASEAFIPGLSAAVAIQTAKR